MNKSMIASIVLLILAAVILVGSQTFLSPCVHEEGTFGACHWAGKMEMGIGCLLGCLALLSICLRSARPGAFISAIPACVLGILTPGTLIDLCHMSTMRCRMLMQPAMILLFSAALLCALIGALLTKDRVQ